MKYFFIFLGLSTSLFAMQDAKNDKARIEQELTALRDKALILSETLTRCVSQKQIHPSRERTIAQLLQHFSEYYNDLLAYQYCSQRDNFSKETKQGLDSKKLLRDMDVNKSLDAAKAVLERAEKLCSPETQEDIRRLMVSAQAKL